MPMTTSSKSKVDMDVEVVVIDSGDSAAIFGEKTDDGQLRIGGISGMENVSLSRYA